MQITEISLQNADYPDMLREIANPPKQLYTLGDLPKGVAVAIVGSRKPTDYGRQVTYQLAGELAAAGIAIVSGLAYGIDSIAHEAALDAGGQTVAVLGHGLDMIYPSAHRGLAKRILATGGALISEYESGIHPDKFTFPTRNRIISGLCQAVIVTEADAKSGSLITTDFAVEQNRTIMAVPGNITSARSAGPNNLLRQGATPVVGSADVMAAINYEIGDITSQPVGAKSQEEAAVLGLLQTGGKTTQDLIAGSGLSAAQFANIISLMEITGKVRNLGAGTWVKR